MGRFFAFGAGTAFRWQYHQLAVFLYAEQPDQPVSTFDRKSDSRSHHDVRHHQCRN